MPFLQFLSLSSLTQKLHTTHTYTHGNMGVPGLRKYLHTRHDYAFERETHTAETTTRTGRRKLYIDGANFAFSTHFPCSVPLEGGNYASYAEAVKKGFYALHQCGFDVVVVFDGVLKFTMVVPAAEEGDGGQQAAGRDRELDDRDLQRIQQQQRILAGNPKEGDVSSMKPALIMDEFRLVCQELAITTMTPLDLDGDPILACLADQDGAYIFSNDADFFLFSYRSPHVKLVALHPKFFSIGSNEVILTVWNPRAFCEQENIKPMSLPLLGLLSKNDYVTSEEADVFQNGMNNNCPWNAVVRIKTVVRFLKHKQWTSMEQALSAVRRVCAPNGANADAKRLLTAIRNGLASSDLRAISERRYPSQVGRLHRALTRPGHIKNKPWRRLVEAYRLGSCGPAAILRILFRLSYTPRCFLDDTRRTYQAAAWQPVCDAVVGIAFQGWREAAVPFVTWTTRRAGEVSTTKIDRLPTQTITDEYGHTHPLPTLNALFTPGSMSRLERLDVLRSAFRSRGLPADLDGEEERWLLPLCALRLWRDGPHVPADLAIADWQVLLLLVSLQPSAPSDRRQASFDWNTKYSSHTEAIRITYAWQSVLKQGHQLADLLGCDLQLTPSDLTRRRGLFLELWSKAEAFDSDITKLDTVVCLVRDCSTVAALDQLNRLAAMVSPDLFASFTEAMSRAEGRSVTESPLPPTRWRTSVAQC